MPKTPAKGPAAVFLPGDGAGRDDAPAGELDYGLLPDESEDHFLVLEPAQLVGTEPLLTTRDTIEAAIKAKVMKGVYGPAGSGKTMSVKSALCHWPRTSPTAWSCDPGRLPGTSATVSSRLWPAR
ncbi:hypothetical protein ACIOGT_36355 [Streptomyces microflavus]|uniref:hypothetical protein n=1 Tax=Streptomyces microflavus TaxID=1919 RepID=UPI0037F29304